MLVVYDSKTGKVKQFVSKLKLPAVRIVDNLIVNEPFVLVTYTIGFGEVPETTNKFLINNHFYLRGVASSGNKVWGLNFAKSADIISAQYNVPIICKFELAGTDRDVEKFLQGVERLVTNSKMDSAKQ